MASRPFPDPAGFLRRQLVRQVRAVFNDPARGEAPVPISDNAYFERDTPIRMVHADVVSMLVGGMSALLLQMLHPHALQGVLDHSTFRTDLHGRLRRTARFIAVTTYGERSAADAVIARVNAIHAQVKGTLPDGTPYSAQDPRTLAWVHVTEAHSFLEAYLRYVRPDMPAADQDRYFAQMALVGGRLHADPLPESRAEAAQIMAEMRGELAGGSEAREAARLVLASRPPGAMGLVQSTLATAAVDMLPPYARTMLALDPPGLSALPARLATRSFGETLRWAFRQDR
jgi:uncharacterized protein (DUF2236 family)